MKTRHAPFSLYKKRVGDGEFWYARYWDEKTRTYKKHRALGISVEGKKERKSEAERAAAELVELLSGYAPSGKSFVDYLKAFWAYDSTYFKEAEIQRGQKLSVSYSKASLDIIRLHIEPYKVFTEISISRLTPAHLRDFIVWESERGVSNVRINRAMQVIRVPVRRAFDNDEITTDPFRKIKNAFARPKEKGVLTEAEAGRLISDPTTQKHVKRRLMALLGLLCGMRLGEVRGLCWEDIDFENQIINIKHNWQDLEGLKQPKWGSFRSVPMLAPIPQLLNIIREGAERGLVFARRKDGKPPVCSSIQKAASLEMEETGISKEAQRERLITFHSLRHSFVTLGRLAGLNDFQIQALAGHKSAAMMERYSHPNQALDLNKCLVVLQKFAKKI